MRINTECACGIPWGVSSCSRPFYPSKMSLLRRLLFFLLFFLNVCPCLAIRQGTATAELFIKRYTQSGDFGRLVLWHATAAECLKRISVPMNEIAHDYYVRHGYEKWAVRAKKEGQEIQEQYQFHRTRAEIAQQQLVGGGEAHTGFIPGECQQAFIPLILIFCNPDCLCAFAAERKNIKKFIEIWLPRYPNRFLRVRHLSDLFQETTSVSGTEQGLCKSFTP